ncbi:hypothetical protein BO70DRAFT_195465 [Aspergillus heteromorphus CBS 117.55]|uniref:Uncharacterized protein n=1 Tax=Aspergillus heteromorphus CBS 117.55 TaxID=1448321 RepID=A0A317WMA2_9EURO|nr:uncharacterized protein BO70DRAFT_195465 [Aspergillus heteromorphus CBS 117.55]PWY87489.1 hypothetical protein BO70DRAFT_195465 [Aspergillus heteromorphus CBS 117.55]
MYLADSFTRDHGWDKDSSCSSTFVLCTPTPHQQIYLLPSTPESGRITGARTPTPWLGDVLIEQVPSTPDYKSQPIGHDYPFSVQTWTDLINPIMLHTIRTPSRR